MKKWQMATAGTMSLVVLGGLLVAGVSAHTTTATSPTKTSALGNASLPKGQTITLWSVAGGPQLADVKKIANAWAAAHGDKVVVVDQSANPKGFQFFATASRAGTGPDVEFGMPHDNNGTFAEEGLLASVPTGMLKASAYNHNTMDAISVNGTQYSVPVSVQAAALYYNKKLIPNAPKTWNEFTKDASAHGFMYDQANLYFDYALIGGMGGYVFKSNHGALNADDIGLANAGAISAYQLMYDMDHKYKWMTPSTNGSVAKAQFTAGKIGLYVSGPWDTGDIKKAGINYGVAPWPTLSNGKPATPFLGVITSFVSAKSKTQAADWSLIQALSNNTAQLDYFKDSQQIPATLSVQKNSLIQKDQTFKSFSNALTYAVPMPNIPQMQAVWTAMSILQNIVAGKISPAQGGKDLVQNIKKGIAAQGN